MSVIGKERVASAHPHLSTLLRQGFFVSVSKRSNSNHLSNRRVRV